MRILGEETLPVITKGAIKLRLFFPCQLCRELLWQKTSFATQEVAYL